MNLSINGLNGFSIFSQKFGIAGMLKSTQDKLERQQKAQSQIEFFENQKENLKKIAELAEDYAPKTEEDEMLTETELLTPEEVKYKRIDILI